MSTNTDYAREYFAAWQKRQETDEDAECLDILVEWVHECGEGTSAKAYAERGYDDPENSILMDNWNNYSRALEELAKEAGVIYVDYSTVWGSKDRSDHWKAGNDIDRILEKNGYKVEWSEQWATCDNCYKAVRTSGDSYGWQPYFMFDSHGEVLCTDCCKEFPDDVLDVFRGNAKCIPFDFEKELVAAGYKQWKDRMEAGFHSGMNDDPKVLVKNLTTLGVKDFVFTLDDNSQFYSTFSCWVHADEWDRLPDAKEVSADQGWDTATEFSKALQGKHSDHVKVEVTTWNQAK